MNLACQRSVVPGGMNANEATHAGSVYFRPGQPQSEGTRSCFSDSRRLLAVSLRALATTGSILLRHPDYRRSDGAASYRAPGAKSAVDDVDALEFDGRSRPKVGRKPC